MVSVENCDSYDCNHQRECNERFPKQANHAVPRASRTALVDRNCSRRALVSMKKHDSSQSIPLHSPHA